MFSPSSLKSQSIFVYQFYNNLKPLLQRNGQQKRTVANFLDYLKRAKGKCPKKLKESWNYEHCNHFMNPKDYEFQETRRQTEGDYGRIIWKFRDPGNPKCPATYMPGCYTLARVDTCEDYATSYTIQEKRECPYKSFAECYTETREKHKTECDLCSHTDIYLPFRMSVLRPQSDCCLNCMSQPVQPYKKNAPYSNHCLARTNFQSCFWPVFKES